MAKKKPAHFGAGFDDFILLTFASITYLTLCKCKELEYLAGYQEPSNLARR
ncbi:hypothetical protein K08M4_23350 [Vibrio syngnathi]|uniref:Uncharacterized protein n=1 Tax=Vibrio syngnathi TaxID=3034029 RepID=A0AA34TRU3_9VIBR|nr:hypothetical protein K08M4_23350 [Vibrio syngnathi]